MYSGKNRGDETYSQHRVDTAKQQWECNPAKDNLFKHRGNEYCHTPEVDQHPGRDTIVGKQAYDRLGR